MLIAYLYLVGWFMWCELCGATGSAHVRPQ